jgi:hypothetical protein
MPIATLYPNESLVGKGPLAGRSGSNPTLRHVRRRCWAADRVACTVRVSLPHSESKLTRRMQHKSILS